jgi:hypothetical protein
VDALSGVGSIWYKVNDGNWQVYCEPFCLSGGDGDYTIWFYAKDVAGNAHSLPFSKTIRLQTNNSTDAPIGQRPTAPSRAHSTTNLAAFGVLSIAAALAVVVVLVAVLKRHKKI